MRRLAVACLLISLACSQAAIAEPAAAPDVARMAAADRLLDAIHYDDLTNRTVEAIIAEAQKSFPQQMEERLKEPLPADLRDKLFAVIANSIRRATTQNRANIRRGTAMIYASRFTTAEIERLIEIQRDPVMAKMQVEMPQIMAESAALGRAAVQAEMPQMAKDIEQVVKDYFAANGGSPPS